MEPKFTWPKQTCAAEQAAAFSCHQSPVLRAPMDTVPPVIKNAEPSLDVNMGQKYLADMELLDSGTSTLASDLSLLFILIALGGLIGFLFVRLAPLGRSLATMRAFLGFGGILSLLLIAAALSFAWAGGLGLLACLALLALGGAAYLAVWELLVWEAQA